MIDANRIWRGQTSVGCSIHGSSYHSAQNFGLLVLINGQINKIVCLGLPGSVRKQRHCFVEDHGRQLLSCFNKFPFCSVFISKDRHQRNRVHRPSHDVHPVVSRNLAIHLSPKKCIMTKRTFIIVPVLVEGSRFDNWSMVYETTFQTSP